MIPVRVCDPGGPRWARSVAPVLGIALVALGALGPGDARVRAPELLLGVAALLGQGILRLRFAPRPGSVELCGGSIRVRAGALSQRIRAAQVRAASTARTSRGVALAVVQAEPRSRPVVLEVSTDEELESLRRSLQIGHYGFGELAWPTTSPAGGPIRSVFLALLACGWTVMALAAACGSAMVCLALALGVVPLSLISLLDFVFARAGHVSLTAHAVTLSHPTGSYSACYRDIVRVDGGPDGLTLWTSRGAFVVPTRGITPPEREHLRAQIECAAARSQGKGQPPPGVPAALSLLAPRGETMRAWLERVDAAAAALADGGGAYRRADITTADLWAALESADAPPPLRAAAARVLARVVPDEASTRIGLALAAERDDRTRARIRVALEEDLDVAARDLDRLVAGDRDS
jgi:hypothetical protein